MIGKRVLSLPFIFSLFANDNYTLSSNQEIAKILNVSVKTVEMRLYRAKMKMRELLKHEE